MSVKTSTPSPKRPVGYQDVVWGAAVETLFIVSIFYGLDLWLSSPPLLNFPLNLIGVVWVVLGVAVAFWCLKTVSTIPREPILVTWGPWARVRHPIYLASLLSNLGAAMFIGTSLLILEFAAYALLETLAASCEERRLRRIFPQEYEAYSKRVPRWFPRIRGAWPNKL